MGSALPDKLYVELTTHCNLHCEMCVKYAAGSLIPEEMMSRETFSRLLPTMPAISTLILNGIGEPLLHPDLEWCVAQARAAMGEAGCIGFQSNGLLFDHARARALLEAGLSTVCFSVDMLRPVSSQPLAKGHQLAPVCAALAAVREGSRHTGRACSLGCEVVVTRETVPQLPDMVRWACEQQLDYMIVSHMFSYDGRLQDHCLFNPNSTDAADLYAKWQQQADAQGLSLEALADPSPKFHKTAADKQLLALGAALQQQARQEDIRFHLPNLLQYELPNQDDGAVLAALFAEALAVANHNGIRLQLPPLRALAGKERRCAFMQEKAAFVTCTGEVMPCHFLWHTYTTQVNLELVPIQARSFGNIHAQSLAEIWQLPQYRLFREEALATDYAPCWSCSSGPCPDLVNPNLADMHDCYGTQVPCGHCMWSLGWTHCL